MLPPAFFRLFSLRRPLSGLLIATLCWITPAHAQTPPCAADCDGDGHVTISELVRVVSIALGEAAVATCSAADLDDDGRVQIDELLIAVNAALTGCPAAPSPTATVSNTPTSTLTATRTSSPSETPTAPPTASFSATASVTPTPPSTATASITATPSLTPTASASPTASETPTGSPTATPTATPTLSPTPRMTPPLSTRNCGNGIMEPGEDCDDHNHNSGDGCSVFCRSEAHPDPCAGIVPVSGTNITAVRIASGLSQPLYATSPPDDFNRLFIVEQVGRIRIRKNGMLLPTPFLDLRGRVVAGGERGLLGLAFHPNYASNGEFFVDYTTTLGSTLVSIISRFHVSAADPDVADPNSEEILLQVDKPYVAHNGGQLTFDAAGYLYISFGDGGQSASVQNNAQDPTSFLGKILRVDVDGGAPYAIPNDNPFAGPDGVLDEIWALGLRNPWRFSFDRANGNTYIGDVGDSTREEIDVMPAGDSGLNFGWCCSEGTLPFPRCYRAANTCPADEGALTPPALEYDHNPACSVTGGFVYRGCALPDLRGTYFYSDFCASFVRSFTYHDGVVGNQHDWTAEIAPGGGQSIDRVVSFGEDARGELYICDLGGEVFKIVPK